MMFPKIDVIPDFISSIRGRMSWAYAVRNHLYVGTGICSGGSSTEFGAGDKAHIGSVPEVFTIIEILNCALQPLLTMLHG